MTLTVAGVNHRTAPVALREKLVFDAAGSLAALARLAERAGTSEGVLLSTCNRTEFYVVTGEGDPLPDAELWSLLSARLGADASTLGYVRRGDDVVAHLFRVASGLDSMILGEAQIHGQVRAAWEHSRAASGPVLNRLFQTALLVSSRVRTETAIARGAASVSSAAVQLAKQIFGSLRGRSAMVLGAGEMAELALECLESEGVRAAVVSNRSTERAGVLARRHGARIVHYDAYWSALEDVDLLVCSTSAPHPVVTADRVSGAIAARRDRPLCVLDIALPRDVDPAVGELTNVYLYDLDDLQSVVAANIERRRSELPAAESLISAEATRYGEWLAALASVPTLRQFRAEMDRLREQELAHTMRRLGHLPPAERAMIDHFSRALMNKFLHSPTVRLREAAANGGGLGAVEALRYLFALEDGRMPDDSIDDEPDTDASPAGGN